MAKTFKDMLAEGNAAIETLTVEAAQALLESPEHLFLDVRETVEVAKGTIPGSVHAPRGLLEFQACPTSPMRNQAIDGSKTIVLFCGSGGRSALAGKTLKELGFEKVVHIGGGFGAWEKAGGAVKR